MFKKAIMITMIYLSFFCGGVLLGLYFQYSKKTPVQEAEGQASLPAAATPVTTALPAKTYEIPTADDAGAQEIKPVQSGYMLRNEENVLYIYDYYSDGSIVVNRTMDKKISVLPENDRERLKDGIYVSNNQELAQIIEDLFS